MKASIIFLLTTLCVWSQAWGGEPTGQPDDTMLMFVGEDLSVVTVASRRPETPAAAPAIARIVDHRTMEERGFETLAEVLAKEPGFSLSSKARGTVPYLRGVPDGVLFLYDGVPVTMDVTKDFHPLDRELSLAGTERVEIVRGPGSVLWGPDAFAGIVNVVPMRGRDQPGLKAGVFGGSEDLRGGYLNWGITGKGWDAFLSGSGAAERYPQDTYNTGPVAAGGFFEQDRIGLSHYLELAGNIHFGDWLSVSGRVSDFKRRYTMQDVSDITWAGERKSPINYLKATLTRTIGPSHFSLTGYVQDIRYDVTDVDLSRSQENRIYAGELLWDRRLFQRGLLTAGASFRENKVTGAVVRGGFLPDFLKPENKIFLPVVEQADYDTRLSSVFLQYRHTLQDWSWWLGTRYDDHSQYDSTLSYSLGANWAFKKAWRMKVAYGTAYRSPYSSQIFGGKSFDPEAISTVNAQLAWNPAPERLFTLTGFYSHLRDHIQEDPYGGLSFPSSQKILGLEFSAKTPLWRNLKLDGNITALHNYGEDDQFRAFKYAFVSPDGTKEVVYDTWKQPFDSGPGFMGNLALCYSMAEKTTLTLDAQKSSSIRYSYAKGRASGWYSQPLLLNLAFLKKDLLWKKSSLTFRWKNMLDRDYTVPGLYGPVEGEGASFCVEWSVRF